MEPFPLRLRHPAGPTMELERDRVLVELRERRVAAAAEDIFATLGLVVESDIGQTADASDVVNRRINHTSTRKWARTADGTAFRPALFQQPRDRRAVEQVTWVAPVYRVHISGQDELLAVLPHVLMIRSLDVARTEEALDRVRRNKLREDTVRSKYLAQHRCFLVPDPLDKPAWEWRDGLSKDGGLELELELMPMFVPTAHVPNDPLYASQWDMDRIGASGPGFTAWNTQRGQAAIIICILDEGCDLNHPDLQNRASDGINLGTMSGDGAPTGPHGTACAGIAAAPIGNSIGVAGVAGGCRFVPAAFSAWTDLEVANGIHWATDAGARVISMSFGWNAWNPAIIDPEIQYAFDHDVVMCVATHNYNTANGITYPATNPLVMACGATDQNDNRKSPASPDGEPWGSNYGPQMSVVAPGVLCPTTDQLGPAGYTNGDYRMNFNGTSAATPHVAGLGALLLSCESSLSNMDVRTIIEQTADKVGSVPYAITAGHPNGTWNNEMGYGRINAYRAVRQVCKTLLVDVKVLIDHKPIFVDVGKREFKEKERIDEVKGQIGYENPDIFNRVIFEHILERLERLEKGPQVGEPFIRRELRPVVAQHIVAEAPRPEPEPPAPKHSPTPTGLGRPARKTRRPGRR